MTYAKSSTILASDLNTFAGLTGTAAASSAAAQNKAGCLWGIGFGDRGYGQSSPNLTTLSAGTAIGQEWQNLRTTIANLASWQNTATTLLPASSAFNAGASIVAHERDSPSLNAFDIQDELVLVDTNRLNYVAGNMTLTSNATSSTRGTTWGAGAGGITCTFQVVFASEDAARYFFNTGGDIRIALAHPSTATSRDSSWNTVLSNLSVAFRANETVRLTGTTGTAQAVGYYQLTTSFQTIHNGLNSGVSPYTINDYLVEARSTAITGLNGAKGTTLQFRVTLTDEQTNAWQDTVASGTNAILSHFRATTTISIAAPTCSVTTGF